MKLLAELIQRESLSGKETNLADFLLKHLKILGLDPFSQEGNVVVQVKGKDANKTIIFNAHMDTVSAGNLSAWQYPPIGADAGVCVDNKIYGLGASDDKAGVAALLLLAKELQKEQPNIDIWLTFVVREEVDGSGTKSFIEWFKNEGYFKKYKDISAVICEPTDLEEIKIGHRGSIFIQITTYGDSGHGSKPYTIKTNAISEAYKIIKKLKKIDVAWGKAYVHPILGKPSIAVTTISAGEPATPNKFADSCTITADVRTTPELHDKVIHLLEEKLKDFNVSIDMLYEPTRFAYTEPSSDIVTKAKELTKANITINIGSNDLCFFTEAHIPGIIFGPGNHAVIHQTNEYCEVDNIYNAVKIYKQLVLG